jgi:flagellar biosynthesis/type III secretory pathway M-ring protein FliF/YscJ
LTNKAKKLPLGYSDHPKQSPQPEIQKQIIRKEVLYLREKILELANKSPEKAALLLSQWINSGLSPKAPKK